MPDRSHPAGVLASDIPTSRLRTHVLQSGDPGAPPLVLLHGNVSAASFFAPIMAELGERRHCIAPDLRGFGRSEPAPIDARRGLRDFADDLHALLTETGLVGQPGKIGEPTQPGEQPVALLGWSLGGGVAMQYAIDHPRAVSHLILESPVSPYGFGGTRDVAGTLCWPDFAGSGGGTANAEMVRRLAEGDRTSDDPVSPRRVLTGLYGQPPFELAAAEEDALVEAMLEMAVGDDHYPGDAVASANWPGTGPGESGVNNTMSPRFCDLSGFAEITGGPAVLWIRGDADQIVSDTSLVDLGHLGALGAVPGWPGPAVFPAQPMVGQTRAVLDRYRAAGGSYAEHVLHCGHSPHLERRGEFVSLVTKFLA